jgi:putative transport protein
VNVVDILNYIADTAADEKLLLLVFVIAIGSMIGAIKVKGFSLGPAAVLFFALGVSAYDSRLSLPPEIGLLGLALFAYTIGITSGPSFFASIKTGGPVIGVVVVALVICALVTNFLGQWLGLKDAVLSGVFAGSLTNTPALAASTEAWSSDLPTVGYSITYLFGVLAMLFVSLAGLRTTHAKKSLVVQPEPEERVIPDQMTIRVDRDDLPDLYRLGEQYGGIVFSRIMRGDRPGRPGHVAIATDSTVPDKGDILSAVGEQKHLERLCTDIGHSSTVALALDRTALDYRRIIVSSPDFVGEALGDLHLDRKFGAVVTRIRRGDVDFLADDDFVLQQGDRVRVVAPPDALKAVSEYFGDSEQRLTGFSIIGLSLGLLIGVFVGLLQVPLPGGINVSLGIAGGVLIVGLVLGRLQRTGRVIWSIPHGSSVTLTQLGIVLFLAYAGSNSGAAFLEAFQSPAGIRLFFLGIVITLLFGGMVVLGGKYIADFTGAKLAGVIAAAQTQPAVLAYANERADDDPDVSLGYALVYPAAMIAKVILGPLVGRF